jgi:hypothetical protein
MIVRGFVVRERYLIAVNLSDTSSQAFVKVPWEDLKGRTCRLMDALSEEIYNRDGNEMGAPGLFVDLKPRAAHCFEVQVIPAGAPSSFSWEDGGMVRDTGFEPVTPTVSR